MPSPRKIPGAPTGVPAATSSPLPEKIAVVLQESRWLALIAFSAFLALSLWGYTTKRDLTGMGTFLMMGLFGLIIASIVNMIWPSGALGFAISVLGVGIFAGLTAYDTQKIKSMYFYVRGTDFVGKSVVMGALTLYLDFVNMFTFLLNLLGSRE